MFEWQAAVGFSAASSGWGYFISSYMASPWSESDQRGGGGRERVRSRGTVSLSGKDLANHFNVNWLVISTLTPWRGFRALEGKRCGRWRDPRWRGGQRRAVCLNFFGLQGRYLRPAISPESDFHCCQTNKSKQEVNKL